MNARGELEVKLGFTVRAQPRDQEGSLTSLSRPEGDQKTSEWYQTNSQVILVDSQEAPLLDDELPTGVESVVQVTEEQAEAGRGLLFQQVAF